jgi:transposase-like protein
MNFSKEFRQNVVEKVLSGMSVQSQAEELGVSKFRIYQWVRDNKRGDKLPSGPARLTMQEKQTLLLESSRISENDLGEWLRKNGLHSEHLEKWKKEIDQFMQKDNEDQIKIKVLENKIKELETDLERKNQALAEVTALLALKKKLSHLFVDEEK